MVELKLQCGLPIDKDDLVTYERRSEIEDQRKAL
jgi:hypothetical protein